MTKKIIASACEESKRFTDPNMFSSSKTPIDCVYMAQNEKTYLQLTTKKGFDTIALNRKIINYLENGGSDVVVLKPDGNPSTFMVTGELKGDFLDMREIEEVEPATDITNAYAQIVTDTNKQLKVYRPNGNKIPEKLSSDEAKEKLSMWGIRPMGYTIT